MPEASSYRDPGSRQPNTGSTPSSSAHHSAVQRSGNSANELGAGQRAVAGYTALAAGQGCGGDGQDLVAGTAHGRVRWVDVEQGELKADMCCRPVGTPQVLSRQLFTHQLHK